MIYIIIFYYYYPSWSLCPFRPTTEQVTCGTVLWEKASTCPGNQGEWTIWYIWNWRNINYLNPKSNPEVDVLWEQCNNRTVANVCSFHILLNNIHFLLTLHKFYFWKNVLNFFSFILYISFTFFILYFWSTRQNLFVLWESLSILCPFIY